MEITPYTRMVFYYESDRMDIVHHANYIRMAEEARVDFMAKIGLPYDKLEARGILLPLLSASCRYLRPLRFGEHLEVYTKIERYNGFHLDLCYDIFCVESGALCTKAETCHCFTNSALKPLRVRDKYPEIHRFFLEARKATYAGAAQK